MRTVERRKSTEVRVRVRDRDRVRVAHVVAI